MTVDVMSIKKGKKIQCCKKKTSKVQAFESLVPGFFWREGVHVSVSVWGRGTDENIPTPFTQATPTILLEIMSADNMKV